MTSLELTRSGDVISLRSNAAPALDASRWLAAAGAWDAGCDATPVPSAYAKRAPFGGAGSALLRPETLCDCAAPSRLDVRAGGAVF